jgi:hypothetical protein
MYELVAREAHRDIRSWVFPFRPGAMADVAYCAIADMGCAAGTHMNRGQLRCLLRQVFFYLTEIEIRGDFQFAVFFNSFNQA